MGLSDDVDDEEIDDPTTTPVNDAFTTAYVDNPLESYTTDISVRSDVVWDDDESIRVAYTDFTFGEFTFTVHLEGDDARAVAHDLLAAVDGGGDDGA